MKTSLTTKRVAVLLTMLLTILNGFAQGTLNYSVVGLQTDDRTVVSLGSDSYLETKTISADGDYVFVNIPAGEYFIKIEASGYNLPNAQTIIVHEDGSVDPMVGIKLSITKMEADPNIWTHSWSEDVSNSGYTKTVYINTPPVIEFLGVQIVPSDVAFSGELLNKYNIILSDEEETWTQEYAYRLVETLKTITGFSMAAGETKPAKFVLIEDNLFEDIAIEKYDEAQIVRISKACFVYANPFLVNLDGVRGRFFSKRLHHAMVNFATDFGNDSNRVNSILHSRFGCTTNVPDYSALTAGITNEDAARFQAFNPEELVSIINMFEELPEGFHKTAHLNYLVRRLNGTKHPLYPEAAAVSWCVDNGYIEFMETAFAGDANSFETLRLILHEKTHFLWEFTFSEEIKSDWIELGGWYVDPNSGSGWSTTKDVEFVSAYAHAISPNEDMAESVAHYLKNPELLQSRSLPKYEFIRDRIMHGTRYISKIPDHLTFEVLNLFPDYDYPGKIKRLDIRVEGAPEEDKFVLVEIELNHIEGFEDGASGGLTRITSPVFIDADGERRSQFVDIRFAPVDGNPHLLRGSANISKYSKNGYWSAGDITITDIQGNQRFSGRNDCVWNMYVNNPLEDVEAPKYVPGSLNYELTDTIVDGHNAQNLRITYKATDNIGIQSTYARIMREKGAHSFSDTYGTYNSETQIATVDFLITEYWDSDYYWVVGLTTYDYARNITDTEFSNSPLNQPIQKIYIETPDPDEEAPELDLNRITVYAEPTNPESPDGETLVTIYYYARDNKSGLGTVYYTLRDPQGIEHGEWHYHKNFYTQYFNGDPTVWDRYTISCVLPKGSAPGIWGLSILSLNDKVWNNRTYNFVETLIFEPDNSTTDYVLFAELENNNTVNLNITSETEEVFGFTYRIINEDTGEEIAGAVSEEQRNTLLRVGNSELKPLAVDVSGLSDGKLVVIVQIKDADDQVTAVRTGSVYKESKLITNICLDKQVVKLKVGETEQLIASITPNNATNKNISWTSSDESVATVDGNGLITALSQGQTTIKVTTEDGNYSADCVITVLKYDQTITFEILPIKYLGDENFELQAVSSSGLTIDYISSDEQVAIIQNGVVRIIGLGSTMITAYQAGNDMYSEAEPVSRELRVLSTDTSLDYVAVNGLNAFLKEKNKSAYEITLPYTTSISLFAIANNPDAQILEEDLGIKDVNEGLNVFTIRVIPPKGLTQVYVLEVTVNTPVSMDEIRLSSVSLFPNPATDYFVIAGASGSKVVITDFSGRILYIRETITEKEKIYVSGWEAGTYLVLIQREDDQVTRKLMIK